MSDQDDMVNEIERAAYTFARSVVDSISGRMDRRYDQRFKDLEIAVAKLISLETGIRPQTSRDAGTDPVTLLNAYNHAQARINKVRAECVAKKGRDLYIETFAGEILDILDEGVK